jgi:hypothetical protein
MEYGDRRAIPPFHFKRNHKVKFMWILRVFLIMALASCGADGAPEKPKAKFSGQIAVGVGKDGTKP